MGPAVEDTDGRSASDRTRPRFFFFGFCSTRSPYRGTGFRYRIRLLPGLACGVLPDGSTPWRKSNSLSRIKINKVRGIVGSTLGIDVRRASMYGCVDSKE